MRHRILIGILICGSIGFASQPGEPFKPGKLPPAEVAALASGMTLRFYAKPDDKTPLDARRVRLAALHVPADSPPTPFLAAGLFHAKLIGYLKNPLKGDYSFKLVGTGVAILKVNDKTLLTLPGDKDKSVEVELAKNYNKIEIAVTSGAKGEATVRLYWAGEKFGFEPVPPDVLFSRKDDADLVEKTVLRDGRQLFAESHCASCHKTPTKLPEFTNSAPTLDKVSERFQYDWLVAWIANPRELRPEAHMPIVLHGPDAQAKAADIATYLMSLYEPTGSKPIGAKPADGAALAKRLGCSTCHRPDEPKKPDDLGRLSHYFTGAKYVPGALAAYLKEPHKRYAWTRMPDFKLTDIEASQLEAHLRNQSKGKPDAKIKGDAKRGAQLYVEAGCVRCHGDPTGNAATTPAVRGFDALDKGCLAAKDLGAAPDFGFKPEQRAALAAFLKNGTHSLAHEVPAEFSLRQVKSLRCDSCHRRDGESTRWHVVLEDEGKEPEKLPSLTWVGEKLKPTWTKNLLEGLHDQRARPWIKARMPAFPARAELLAVGLSHEHGFAIDEDERPTPDAKLAAIGEKLVPQQGGFHCNNCHGIGKTPPTAPFEAPGINLTDAALRLRYAYYQRWMLAPDRVDVTMRMPVFATDGKMTQIREVFDGDARRQFDALWHYIQTLPEKTK